MSAAAPLPPPGAPRANTMNGYAKDAYAWGAGNDRGSGNGAPPISEISAAAVRKVEEYRHQPVRERAHVGDDL